MLKWLRFVLSLLQADIQDVCAMVDFWGFYGHFEWYLE